MYRSTTAAFGYTNLENNIRLQKCLSLVRSQIQTVRELAPLQEGSLEQLEPFAAKVLNLATFLDTRETQAHLSNPTLIDELIRKLPTSRRMDWALVASKLHRHPSVKDFAEWITGVADVASFVCMPTTLTQQHTTARYSNPTTSHQRI